MSKKAPSAPDPVATAQAQGQANAEAVRESAKVNAVNQYTPYGSVTYQKDANGVPISQTSSLSAPQQQILDQQNQLGVTLGGKAINQSQYLPTDQYSLAQFGALPTSQQYQEQGKQIQDAYYGKQMGMLDPQFAQENRSLEQNIANRGLPIAGEAATTLQDNQYRRQSDARGQAMQQAILSAGNEQTRLYNQDMGARQQGISEYNAQRQQPFNELSAYLQGQPVFSAPQSSTSQYQVAPADVAGNIYQNYNAKNQAYQNNLNGMYQIAGTAATAAMMSDRRLKRFIEPIGKMEHSGLTVYRYQYKWSKKWHVGVMADEVRNVIPDAVIRTWTGYDMVDYGKIW